MHASEVRSLKWEVGIFYTDPASAKTLRPSIILRLEHWSQLDYDNFPVVHKCL